MDTFLEDAPALLAELRSARAAADADRFRRAAHSLKSNSHTFGATALGALARDAGTEGAGRRRRRATWRRSTRSMPPTREAAAG